MLLMRAKALRVALFYLPEFMSQRLSLDVLAGFYQRVPEMTLWADRNGKCDMSLSG